MATYTQRYAELVDAVIRARSALDHPLAGPAEKAVHAAAVRALHDFEAQCTPAKVANNRAIWIYVLLVLATFAVVAWGLL